MSFNFLTNFFFYLKNKRTNFNSDRDEIRRKLAIVSSSSSSSSFNDQTNSNNEPPIVSDYLRKNTYAKSYLGID